MSRSPRHVIPDQPQGNPTTPLGGLLNAAKTPPDTQLLPGITGPELVDLCRSIHLHTGSDPRVPLAELVSRHIESQVSHLIINACDIDPLHHQTSHLCEANMHMVLAGAELIARALQIQDITVVQTDTSRLKGQLHLPIPNESAKDTKVRWHTRTVPGAHVHTKHAALVNLLLTGSPLPRPSSATAELMRSHKTHVAVYDAEPVASVALAAHNPNHVTKYLLTVRHDKTSVLESEPDTPVGRYFPQNRTSPVVLVGGVEGQWTTVERAATLTADPSSWKSVGLLPASASYWFPTAHECPVEITSRLLHYMASQSTRRCGPCVNGLPALAHAFDKAAEQQDFATVTSIGRLLSGRGACSTPEGATRLARSALELFPKVLSWPTRKQSQKTRQHA